MSDRHETLGFVPVGEVEDIRVQKTVWSIDIGAGRWVILWSGALLLAVTLSLLYTAHQFRGLERAEAMDMAQLARNIARGQGFITYVIRPLSLWQLETHARDHRPRPMNHPDLYNPPLYPLVLAGLFKLMPLSIFEYKMTDMVYKPERWVIVPFNQLCLLATLLLVYVWARKLFDQRVAVTAGLLLLFSDTLWAFSISGLPTNFLMLLFLAALFCLWRADERWHPDLPELNPRKAWPGWTLLVTSAVLMGLCFLTRYTTAFLFVPVLVYAAFVCRGRGVVLGILLYVLIYAAIITPWLFRNASLCGSPFGIAYYEFTTDISPAMYRPNFDHSFEMNPLGRRWLTQSRTYLLEGTKHIGSDFLVFFFVVAMLYRFRRPHVMRLRRLTWAAILTAIAGLSALRLPADAPEGPHRFVQGSNLLVLFLPLVVVYGTAFFYLLLDRITFPARILRWSVLAAFGLANAASLLYSLSPPRRGPYPYPPYCAYYTALAAKWFDKDELGASDMPWSMAWVGDLRTLWLPTTAEQLVMIHDFVAPKGVSFILLTPYLLNGRLQSDLTKGEYKSWFAVISGRVPPNFPLKTVTLFPPAGEQILYADRARWADKQIGEAPTGRKPSKKTDAKTNPR
ncbi:MAG: glycosyltransferase family 39 protein [Verrucomicrobiae bacterium]|nr:glycosyltransferase family 39 protein [Verrucomicrobiae bacterium]